MNEDSEMDIKEFVHGINFVRPPTLEFTKLQETDDFIVIQKALALKFSLPRWLSLSMEFTNWV